MGLDTFLTNEERVQGLKMAAVFEALRRPFALDDHAWRDGKNPEEGKPYVVRTAIIERLHDVDPTWEFSITGGPVMNGDTVTMVGEMSIYGVKRQCVATAIVQRFKNEGGQKVEVDSYTYSMNLAQAIKSATSSLIQRGAKMFNCTTYLGEAPFKGMANSKQGLRKLLIQAGIEIDPSSAQAAKIVDDMNAKRHHNPLAPATSPQPLGTANRATQGVSPFPQAQTQAQADGSTGNAALDTVLGVVPPAPVGGVEKAMPLTTTTARADYLMLYKTEDGRPLAVVHTVMGLKVNVAGSVMFKNAGLDTSEWGKNVGSAGKRIDLPRNVEITINKNGQDWEVQRVDLVPMEKAG